VGTIHGRVRRGVDLVINPPHPNPWGLKKKRKRKKEKKKEEKKKQKKIKIRKENSLFTIFYALWLGLSSKISLLTWLFATKM